MPRSPRLQEAGGIYHVVARGVRQKAIYLDSRDRHRFLGLLADVLGRSGWRCLTYCLMGNHYHLVLQLSSPNLSDGMRRLNGEYAQRFALRHQLPGHVFGGRYWSKPVTSDAHLVSLLSYIALNPVRAGLCHTADDWPWSAHTALLGEAPPGVVDVGTALSYIDERADRARTHYSHLVQAESGKGVWPLSEGYSPEK